MALGTGGEMIPQDHPGPRILQGGVADGEVGVFKGAAHFLFYLCILG